MGGFVRRDLPDFPCELALGLQFDGYRQPNRRVKGEREIGPEIRALPAVNDCSAMLRLTSSQLTTPMLAFIFPTVMLASNGTTTIT